MSKVSSGITRQKQDLRQLRKLELGWPRLTDASDLLWPLLKTLGGRLSHLCLENLASCDILALGRHCPSLHHLKLSAFQTPKESLDAINFEVKGFFSQLEELFLFNSREADLPLRVMTSLMTSRLRTAYFQNVRAGWGDLLGPAAASRLETVSFENCCRLSLDSLLQLIKMDSPLSK
jgi:hypothetical protein